MQLADWGQPSTNGIIGRLIHRGPDATATIMTDDDYVGDFEYIDSELERSSEIRIGWIRQVRHIAVNEHFARIEIDDLRRGHPAVRATNPEVSRLLLPHEPLEEVGVVPRSPLSPSPVAIKQLG